MTSSMDRRRRRLLKLIGGGLAGYLASPDGASQAAADGSTFGADTVADRLSTRRADPFRNRIGWAYVARPGRSPADVRADLLRMQRLGMNTVYLVHNNPGNTDPDGIEPGLAPAVWFAVTRQTAAYHDALAIYRAVLTTLDASADLGLDVILSIGYQIQMGEEWNDRHPQELRVDAHNRLLKHWGSEPTASPYSPKYREDIEEYYAWVYNEIVRNYPNIVAINLADEPMGSDFSRHAMLEFLHRYGTSFDEGSFHEQGEFLAGVVADYAVWSAEKWLGIDPSLTTMMTFHVDRNEPFFPSLEKIFARTPPTFVFSADTHLDDGPADRRIPPESVNLLHGLTSTLGWISRVYGKPLMLWTSANSWGLKETGGVREALLNFDIVHDRPRQVGGHLGMILAWAWNVKWQGVYDDEGYFPQDKDEIINAVSEALAARRDRLSESDPGLPDQVLYAPSDRLYREFGGLRLSHLAHNLAELHRFDFAGQKTIYLTDGRALDEARRFAVPVRPGPLPT